MRCGASAKARSTNYGSSGSCGSLSGPAPVSPETLQVRQQRWILLNTFARGQSVLVVYPPPKKTIVEQCSQRQPRRSTRPPGSIERRAAAYSLQVLHGRARALRRPPATQRALQSAALSGRPGPGPRPREPARTGRGPPAAGLARAGHSRGRPERRAGTGRLDPGPPGLLRPSRGGRGHGTTSRCPP